MTSLAGKVVIVTGALGGIGRATARTLAEAGARVVATDLASDGGVAFADELSRLGSEAMFLAADQADEDQVRVLVDETIARFGKLDGAFNNGGVAQQGKPLIDVASDQFDRIMRVNVLGVFHCLKHQMAAMAGGGSIVVTSSGLGVMALLHQAAYIASKHAVCGLVRAAAIEGAPERIRVNAVLPGSIRTPMQEAAHGRSLDVPESLERARQLHPLGRQGEPVEVAHATRWLLSDEASFVTGALVPVDGGLTAGRRL